jgi:hypothetical protein
MNNEWAEISNVLQPKLSSAVMRESSAKEALYLATNEVRKIMIEARHL